MSATAATVAATTAATTWAAPAVRAVRGAPAGPFVAVVPSRYALSRRPRAVYARRRLAVMLVLVAVVCSVVWGTGQVLASRGGAPASAPTARPAHSTDVTATAAYAASYVVQPGDTLWSLARRHHGGQSTESYLEQLIEINGGTALEVGQVVLLP